MTLFGSQFSAAFAEVVLLTDAIVISIVLMAVFFQNLASGCIKALHYASAMISAVLMRVGVGRK